MAKLGVCLAACVAMVGAAAPRVPSTDLKLLALNASVGRAVFHLQCRPTGGDLRNNARACAALAAAPELVRRPQPFTCIGGTFSWWDLTITGRLAGQPVRTHVATCWTTQMATIRELGIGWRSLRAHLVPRRRAAVLPGTTRTFPPGQLRAADLVTCEILGHKLRIGVPIEIGSASVGYDGAHVTPVTLRVTHHSDGAVTARCRIGKT